MEIPKILIVNERGGDKYYLVGIFFITNEIATELSKRVVNT